MKERPILFSAPMIRAILAGAKTQTRRLIKPHPPIGARSIYRPFSREPNNWQAIGANDRMCWYGRCPYGYEGELLWVRETHYVWSAGYKDGSGRHINYRATEPDSPNSWTPSIHMPRWASRLTLRITSVRAERLQSISEPDANAEGTMAWAQEVDPDDKRDFLSGRHAFAELWESINAERASWHTNPWVWAVTFERIDAATSAAA